MGRLLLLSMFFVASSIQAQDCVEPVAGKTSQIYICQNAEPFDLQLFMAPTTDGRGSETGGYFVFGKNGSEPALASGNTWFDPGIDTATDYYYRVNSEDDPDCYDTARMTVFTAPAPDSGISGTAEILSTAEPIDLYQFLGGTPDDGGNWNTANGVTFDPSVDGSGIYTYTVQQTTPIGGSGASVQNKTCTSTSTVAVIVIEPVEDEKVLICHKGKTLEIDQDAVQAHLKHGDTLGECSSTSASKTVVFPNPSHGNLNFTNGTFEIQEVRILNFQGGVEKAFQSNGNPAQLEIDISQLRKGIYFAEVITSHGKEVIRLIKK